MRTMYDAVLMRTVCDAVLMRTVYDAVLMRTMYDAVLMRTMCDAALMRNVLLCHRYLENNVRCCVNENCDALLQVPGEQCTILC